MHEIERIIILDPENPITRYAADKVKRNGKVLQLESQLENYIYFSSRALSALKSSISKSRLSLTLLRSSHIEKMDSKELPKGLYIEMLVENSIIRVQSVYDRVLILVNKILDLGISNNQISHNAIVTNEWVERFGLVENIKSIYKACSEYRFIRNTVIHHDRYTEEELDELTLFIEVNDLFLEGDGKGIISDELISRKTDDYLNAKESEFAGYLDKIEQNIFELYEKLVPAYGVKKSVLKKI